MTHPFRRTDLAIRLEPSTPGDAVAAALVQSQPQQSPVKPWGSPMEEAVPTKNENRSTGDNANSWGRSATLTYLDKPSELVRVQLEVGESLTLWLAVPQPPLTGIAHDVTIDTTVWFVVIVGGGSTSIQRLVRGDDIISIPLVATYVSVSAYIGDPAGKPLNTTNFSTLPNVAQASAFLVRGVRGIPGQATVFGAEVGSAIQATPGPARIASISAHLTAASSGTEQFLQLFDASSNPGAGAIPVMEFALGETPEASAVGDMARFLNPAGFSQAMFAAVSTTSGLLTLSAAEVWFQWEVVLI
jgi:hypothetical protein